MARRTNNSALPRTLRCCISSTNIVSISPFIWKTNLFHLISYNWQPVADLGGGDGGMHPLTSLNITCIWIILNLFKKSNQWIVVSPCDCDIIWTAKGMGGCKKTVFVLRSFYKTEISLLLVRLIWRRQISKTHNLHFSSIKAYEHNQWRSYGGGWGVHPPPA